MANLDDAASALDAPSTQETPVAAPAEATPNAGASGGSNGGSCGSAPLSVSVPSGRRGHRRSPAGAPSSMASLLRKLPSISEIVAQVSPASPGASHHDQSTAEIAAELRTSNPHGMIQVQLLSLDGVASPQPTPISCRVEVAGLVAESCFALPLWMTGMVNTVGSNSHSSIRRLARQMVDLSAPKRKEVLSAYPSDMRCKLVEEMVNIRLSRLRTPEGTLNPTKESRR